MVRKIRVKLVLELRSQGVSARAIAAGQGMSRNSLASVLEAADRDNLRWEDVADLPEHEVYELVFPGRAEHRSVYVQPDWGTMHKALARVGVTLKLLHREDVDQHVGSGQPVMSHDRFCRIY